MGKLRAFSDHKLVAAQAANDAAMAKVRSKLEAIPNGIDKVLTRTANKVAAGAKTEAVRMIPQYLNVKQKDVRKHFSIRRATWKKQEATLMAGGIAECGAGEVQPHPWPQRQAQARPGAQGQNLQDQLRPRSSKALSGCATPRAARC